MKKIIPLLKSKVFLMLLLLLCLSYSVWWQIPNLAIRGDGFVYLIERVRNGYWRIPEVFGHVELGSLLLTRTITPIFKTNISLYWTAELVVIFAINVLTFTAVYIISRKLVVAFAAALIQAVSFFGNWDMYAGGIYAYFTDRVPNMLFMIPGLLFLHLYLDKKKRKYFILSAIFYFLGVFIWHWSLFFTGFFFCYPIFWLLFTKITRKNLIKYIPVSIYYLAVSVFVTYLQNVTQAGLNPRWTFRYFLMHPEVFHYWAMTIRQLVYVSEYAPIFKGFAEPFRYINTPLHYIISPQNAIEITSKVVLGYIIASIVIFIKLPKFRALLFTLIVAILSNFFMNVYVGQYHVATQSGSNRYLYIPAFYLSIFWALFLWAFCWMKKSWLNLVGVLLLGVYFGLNYWLIYQNFQWIMERHIPTNAVWAKAVEVGEKSPTGTLIIIPYFETGPYEAEFLNDQIGKGRVTFISDDTVDLIKAIPHSNNIINIEYDKFCRCVVEEGVKSKSDLLKSIKL